MEDFNLKGRTLLVKSTISQNLIAARVEKRNAQDILKENQTDMQTDVPIFRKTAKADMLSTTAREHGVARVALKVLHLIGDCTATGPLARAKMMSATVPVETGQNKFLSRQSLARTVKE